MVCIHNPGHTFSQQKGIFQGEIFKTILNIVQQIIFFTSDFPYFNMSYLKTIKDLYKAFLKGTIISDL